MEPARVPGADVCRADAHSVPQLRRGAVPEAQRDPTGKGLWGVPEWSRSPLPWRQLPQSVALPGSAGEHGVSSSDAPKLHPPNRGPGNHHHHFPEGEGVTTG